MIAVLAGGVGAARFLRGLVQVIDEEDLVVVGNTGDDLELYGLHVSPDLDTVTYTVSGNANTETGWGLAGETWNAIEAMARYDEPWFKLGDCDLATHLYRTQRLRQGTPLSEVTAEIIARWGLRLRLIPMTDDRLRTRLLSADGRLLDFQEYFVRLHHAIEVREVIYEGARDANPAPGVIEALTNAELVIVAPSNPILSIAPILAVPGIADALIARRTSVIGISPIINGLALKGPADRLLSELGHESSVVGVAKLWSEIVGSLVIDHVDAPLMGQIEACGVAAVSADTVMSDGTVAAALAEAVLGAAREHAALS